MNTVPRTSSIPESLLLSHGDFLERCRKLADDVPPFLQESPPFTLQSQSYLMTALLSEKDIESPLLTGVPIVFCSSFFFSLFSPLRSFPVSCRLDNCPSFLRKQSKRSLKAVIYLCSRSAQGTDFNARFKWSHQGHIKVTSRSHFSWKAKHSILRITLLSHSPSFLLLSSP